MKPRLLNGLSSVLAGVVVAGSGVLSHSAAADWPQFLGPTRNGVYAGSGVSTAWPKDGPPVLWRRAVGQGFAGPVVAQENVILFHRSDNQEIIECLDAKSGETRWKLAYPTAYHDDSGFDEGPRGTPVIDAGKVYAFGAEGMLHCVDFKTGEKIWSLDTKKNFQARKSFFGLASSPLIEGDRLFLNLGGANGAGVAAFDKSTGKLLWKATDHEAGYSSPVAATLDGKRQILFFTREGLVSTDPETGRVQFEFAWRARMNASVNAAAPLVVGAEIFLSESYGTGAVLLRASPGKAARVWSSNDALSNHYATCVYHDGFLYGFHGRQDTGRPALRCVEWKTGKVRWSEDDFGAGIVTLAHGRLLLLHEDGRLLMAEASPQGYKLIQQNQILPTHVRAHPALADGLFFARSPDKLVCVDLRTKAP